jgi:processive 1,2-diacylglycerol beta-glucosyltransferase
MASSALIVVAHASVGSGHRIAAEAIARELRATVDDRASVEVADALTMGSFKTKGDDLTSTFTGPTASLYDAIWSSSDVGRIARVLGTPALAWVFRGFAAYLRKSNPAAVVCTHALPALLAAWEVKRGRLDTQVICVATDFGVHGLWPREDIALFCAADAHSADELERRGHERTAVAITGIPVRSQFTAEYDVAAAREHFSLPADKRVILAVAGSTQAGPYARFKESLAVSLPALASLPGVTLAVVTGQDDAFADALRSRSAAFGTTNVHVLGYVDHMAPLMAAADLGVAKPGGLVCAECIAMGLPLVLVGPAMGQERANATALSGVGAALFAEDPRLLAEYVRKVASKPARLAKMRDAASALGRPFAAADITGRVLGLAGLTPAQDSR